MIRNSNFQINIYRGDWGLGSIDLDCLRILCITRFLNNASISVNTNANPFYSKQGVMPYIKDDNSTIVGYRRCSKFLCEKGLSLNSQLSTEIRSLSHAFENLVFNNLYPYFMYTLFNDPQNVDYVKALYAKRTKFPFNFYYPGKYLQKGKDVLEVFCGRPIEDKIDEVEIDRILLNARQCINLLAAKLNDKTWFFSDTPTEFDALVYSYLSILLNIKCPNNPLQSNIRDSPSLAKFVTRISKTYFGKEIKDYEAAIAVNPEIKNMTPTEPDFQKNKRKTQILAGFGAFFAMISYAAWLGLLPKDDRFDDSVFEYEENDEDME